MNIDETLLGFILILAVCTMGSGIVSFMCGIAYHKAEVKRLAREEAERMAEAVSIAAPKFRQRTAESDETRRAVVKEVRLRARRSRGDR